jgi:tetratricopeptide (TPR) repeat protein
MDPDMCRGTSPEGAVRAKAENIMTQAHASTLLSLRVVEGLSKGLARMAGPKTIVYVSDGFIVQGAEEFVRDATGMANRAGAHFYTIDARGLNKGASSDIIDRKLAFNSAGAFGGFDMQEDGTNALAVDTGGIAIRNENNFGRALDLIQQDAGTYYVLGYTPANQTFDGKYRAIDVSVKRSGVKVRARRGYLALAPAKLLKPVPITTTALSSGAPPATSRTEYHEEPADRAGAFIGPASKTAPPDAHAIRTRIEKGGLVAGLPGDGTAAADDPAARGWAAYQAGDVETAARELKQASASPDARPWVYYVLGFCDLALEHYQDAAASWERVRKATPAFEPVYFNLADAYIGSGAGGTAYAVLEDAGKRWPKDAEILNAEGVIQIHARAYADAIDSFKRATKLAPKDPAGWFNLASAHHANYLHMIDAAPNHNLMGNPRRFMTASRERESAMDAYKKVIALHGEYVAEAKRGIEALRRQ